MKQANPFYVVLLHEGMLNKSGEVVTTSLTLIDIHDMARSGRTYGIKGLFIAHPSPTLHNLADVLHEHWSEGFGSTYNPDRKEAISIVRVVSTLDEALKQIKKNEGKPPRLVATSARHDSKKRISFSELKEEMEHGATPILLMLGTGWGMSPVLLDKVELILEPVLGPGDYNHLSVRSACAIMLDRLFARTS